MWVGEVNCQTSVWQNYGFQAPKGLRLFQPDFSISQHVDFHWLIPEPNFPYASNTVVPILI